MSGLEDSLNAILSDPTAMEQVSRLAAQLMGGQEDGAHAAGPAVPDGELLARLTRLLGSTGGDKTGLVQALAPYLQRSRREKLEKALRMARMVHLARLALEESGGGTDV